MQNSPPPWKQSVTLSHSSFPTVLAKADPTRSQALALRGANFITGEEKKENKAEIESVGKSTSPQQVERNKTSYPIKFSPWIIELDRLTNTTTPVLQALPRLIEVPTAQRQDLLLAKLKQCLVFINDRNGYSWSQVIKAKALDELTQNFNLIHSLINDETIPAFVATFQANCLRSLPPPRKLVDVDFEIDDDTLVLDPNWPQLEIVYTLFLQVMRSSSFTSTHAKKHLSRHLMLQVLELLDTEDPRERLFLEMALHTIYTKAIDARAFLRASIHNVCFRHMYEAERFLGMANLLRLLCKIINGFTIPVRQEHIHMFHRVLLPLFKVRQFTNLFQPLTACIVSMIDKQQNLADDAIKYILKHWPFSHSVKEVLFLEVLHTLIVKMDRLIFQQNVNRIFKRLAQCIESPHFQVAERAMLFFEDRCVRRYVGDFSRRCTSLILPVLLKVLQQHWSETIKQAAMQVAQILQTIDAMAVQKCAHEIELKLKRKEETRQNRERNWAKITQRAEANISRKQSEVLKSQNTDS
eukprot:gene6716-351_t